jgi:hypothetical protein
MADYQLRLAEETKEKIRRLDVAGRDDLQKSPVPLEILKIARG